MAGTPKVKLHFSNWKFPWYRGQNALGLFAFGMHRMFALSRLNLGLLALAAANAIPLLEVLGLARLKKTLSY